MVGRGCYAVKVVLKKQALLQLSLKPANEVLVVSNGYGYVDGREQRRDGPIFSGGGSEPVFIALNSCRKLLPN